MKKQELISIKGLDIKELQEKAKVIKNEIADLIFEKNMNKLKDLKVIYKKKKDLAQVLTIARQKELLGQLESNVDKQESTKEVKAIRQLADKSTSKKLKKGKKK